MLAILALCAASAARGEILVSTNATWRYFKGTTEASDPTNAWREIGFDDSNWSVGEAPFHYGPNPMCGGGDDGISPNGTNCAPGGTILSDMRGKYTCIFMRHKFVVADTSAVVTLNFNFYFDDGLAFWINGRAPRNPITLVGTTNVAYTNIASVAREATVFNRQDISAVIGSLVNGTNVLCVQAFNVNLTNDDFRVDVELVTSDLQPFPLTANQRGTVTCLERPTITYDAYLPPAYSADGNPLPILYTMNPNGGGMVTDFRTVCSQLNIITIGLIGPGNDATWDTALRDFHAVSRDVRQRLRFDPTAEFAGGFSGGGEGAYVFSRFRAQHVAGVFAMGGWLGRSLNYYSTDRVQTNLLVARATGTSDTAGMYYIPRDSNYLAAAGAVIQDWFFAGGHTVAPDSIKSAALSWLLSQRVPSGPGDRQEALGRAASWRAGLGSGQHESVLRECTMVLMQKPRTWEAFQAQLIMDRLATSSTTFRPLNVASLADGDFASDLFYYYARGAATAGDLSRYQSAMKALTGITGVSGDRAGDIRALLLQFGYPAPVLQWSAAHSGSPLHLYLMKDTPGLDYALQSRQNFQEAVWQDESLAPVENTTVWSAELPRKTQPASEFYRVRVTPSAGSSPPWPP